VTYCWRRDPTNNSQFRVVGGDLSEELDRQAYAVEVVVALLVPWTWFRLVVGFWFYEVGGKQLVGSMKKGIELEDFYRELKALSRSLASCCWTVVGIPSTGFRAVVNFRPIILHLLARILLGTPIFVSFHIWRSFTEPSGSYSAKHGSEY
jgi:hypothetical protein